MNAAEPAFLQMNFRSDYLTACQATAWKDMSLRAVSQLLDFTLLWEGREYRQQGPVLVSSSYDVRPFPSLTLRRFHPERLITAEKFCELKFFKAAALA